MYWIYHAVRRVLSSWGCCALHFGIFGDSVGLPPREETLPVFATFLTHNSGRRIPWMIPIGIVAAGMGDNLDDWLGRHFGKTFIRWAKKLVRADDEDIKTAQHLVATHGGRTICFSRLILGCEQFPDLWQKARICIGPVFSYSIWLGGSGNAFADEFEGLLGSIEKESWAIAGGFLLTGSLVWRPQASIPGARERARILDATIRPV